MEIIYKKEQATNIFMVELVYAYNNKVKMLQMEELGQGWKVNIELPDGEYPYKFILNNGIRINDPNAYKYINWLNGETWSILKIHNGKILTREYKETKFDKFRIHNGTSGYGVKTIVYPKDNRCHIGFELNNVCGVHSVTALWYQPDGSLYHIEEATIDSDDTVKSSYAEAFWINLNQHAHPFQYGIWMIEIYVDGERKIREFFSVSDGKGFAKLINYAI